jgi:hypothetical protein
MKILIIKTDGTEKTIEATRARAITAIRKEIGAQYTDIVNLRDGRVMFVDDNGYHTKAIDHGNGRIEIKTLGAKKPVNEKATKLYHRVCKPGTTHQIVGDVAIAKDSEFE